MIESLLRLPVEPFEHFNELQIHNCLVDNAEDFMIQFEKFYAFWSKNPNSVTLPKKQVFGNGQYKGDFRIMPCIIDDDIHYTKAVKIIGTNEENHTITDKICVGKSFLIDKYDNFIFAMFDVAVLSSFRTAAISILAYTMVKRTSQLHSIAIIGLGRIGFYTVLILAKYLNVKNFTCIDTNKKTIENFKKLVALYIPEVNIEFCEVDELQDKCDSVFVATDSKYSILNQKNAHNFSFISSVGADADNLSELDETILKDRIVLTDSLQSMLLGDLAFWKQKGKIDESLVTEMKNFQFSTFERDKKFLFISTGIAVQDAFISRYLFSKLSSQDFIK